ncbi:MAG TPA: hypothetical protein VF755_11375 [Catenuloplanes sp.]|jgi:hypothetical protein
MVTLTARAPAAPCPWWRLLVATVLAATASHAVRLMLDDAAYHGHAFDVLRTLPLLGGPTVRGVALLTLTITAYGAAHDAVNTGRLRPLRVCLTVLVAWYATRAAGLAGAALLHQEPPEWPQLVLAILIAAGACVAARSTARHLGGD